MAIKSRISGPVLVKVGRRAKTDQLAAGPAETGQGEVGRAANVLAATGANAAIVDAETVVIAVLPAAVRETAASTGRPEIDIEKLIADSLLS